MYQLFEYQNNIYEHEKRYKNTNSANNFICNSV